MDKNELGLVAWHKKDDVKLIKYLLKQENESFFDRHKLLTEENYRYAKNLLAEHINTLNTLDELDTFSKNVS